MTPDAVKDHLCRSFCDGFRVAEVPGGLLVETPFPLPDGDHLDFLIRDTGDGIRFEDDGLLVAEARASGVDMDKGARRQLLDSILAHCGVRFDEDDGIFYIDVGSREEIASLSVKFVETLLRAQDVAALTRERVASSFADDLQAALEALSSGDFDFSRNTEDDAAGRENPSDIVVLRRSAPVAVIYAVTSTEKLLSALVRHLEREMDGAPGPEVFAAIEALDKVSSRRFAHAQNLGLAMPIAEAGLDDAARFILNRLKRAA